MAYNIDHLDPDDRTDLYADPRLEEEAPHSGRLLRIAGSLVVMGVFAGGLWFAYTQGMHHAGRSTGSGQIPLIRADMRPFKVKPENPGGMQMPDRDMLIYGEQRPQIEHLLPPPEQPMARPTPPPPAPSPPAPVSPVQTAIAVPSPAPQSSPPEAGPIAPIAAPSAPVTNAAPGSGAVVRSSPAAAHREPDLIAQRIEQLGLAGPETPPKPASAHTSAGRATRLHLQLGAVRTESEAHEDWERLKRKNPDLLGSLSAVAIRADLGDKGTYYRIQAGPIADPSTADRVCGELRQRHLACMIVR
jgi:SPOR domain